MKDTKQRLDVCFPVRRERRQMRLNHLAPPLLRSALECQYGRCRARSFGFHALPKFSTKSRNPDHVNLLSRDTPSPLALAQIKRG